MTDTDRADGYSVAIENGKSTCNLVKRWLDDAIRVETVETRRAGQVASRLLSPTTARASPPGSRSTSTAGLRRCKVNLDDLNQNFVTDEPLRIGGGGGPASRFHGAIDDVRLYNRVVGRGGCRRSSPTSTRSTPSSRRRRPTRTPAQRHKLRTYFLEQHAPPRTFGEADERRLGGAARVGGIRRRAADDDGDAGDADAARRRTC